MASGFDDSDESIGDNKPTIDDLLRHLASRHSPYSQYPPVNLKQFSDRATTPSGEKPFGVKGSRERASFRHLFDKYRSRANRGTDLGVDPDFDVFSVVNKTSELISLLGERSTPSSFTPVLSHISPRPIRSARTSPTRPKISHQPQSTHKRRSRSPKQATPRIPIMSTKQDSKVGAGLPAYAETYAKVLAGNTTHALSLSNRMSNERCFAYEQKDVQVSPGEYTTKIGVLFQVDNPSIVKYTNPRLRTDGKGIEVWLPVCHHVVCGHIEGSATFFQNKIGAVLGADDERNHAIDRMLGTNGQDVKFFDITDANGDIIKDVPFVAHNYLLPPGIETENRYFNPGKPVHDDSHLDCKLIVVTDIKNKTGSTYDSLLDALRDTLPTADNIRAAMTPEDVLQLYKTGTAGFIKAQTCVNTVAFASVEFSVYGEDQAGRLASAAVMNITDLVGAMDFLG